MTNLRLQKTYGHQPRKGSDLSWEAPALEVTWPHVGYLTLVTRQIEKNISPLSQDFFMASKLGGVLSSGGGSKRKSPRRNFSCVHTFGKYQKFNEDVILFLSLIFILLILTDIKTFDDSKNCMDSWFSISISAKDFLLQLMIANRVVVCEFRKRELFV